MKGVGFRICRVVGSVCHGVQHGGCLTPAWKDPWGGHSTAAERGPAHHSSCSSSVALQRHLLGYGTGIESREQLGRVVHVDAQLQRARLLRCSTDGRAAGHGSAAPPHELTRSASLVLRI